MAVQHVVCRMYTPPCRGTVHYFLCRLSLFVPGSLPCALCLLSYFFSPGDRSRSSFIHRDIPFSFLFAFWSCLPLVPSFLRLRCQGARQTRRSLPSHLLSGSIPNRKDSLQVPPFLLHPPWTRRILDPGWIRIESNPKQLRSFRRLATEKRKRAHREAQGGKGIFAGDDDITTLTTQPLFRPRPRSIEQSRLDRPRLLRTASDQRIHLVRASS
ncbi:hypothetical protein J3E68DRAFT_312884 [Trichoderma sp. SZMC 28012]